MLFALSLERNEAISTRVGSGIFWIYSEITGLKSSSTGSTHFVAKASMELVNSNIYPLLLLCCGNKYRLFTW